MTVTTGAECQDLRANGATMDDMPQSPAHAKPATRRDHLWVLAIIAGFALFDVWGAWAQVGDKSGYKVGHTGTGWTLTIVVEAAAGYFLFAWFSAPGRRSRRFAMWSAFATLGLSLIGQGASTLAAYAQPPVWLAVFVKDLPVLVLALIAVLIHLRRLDREDAAEALRQDAKDTEIAALRAELDAERVTLAPLRKALAEAQREAGEANAKREIAERKLAAQKANGRRTKPANGSQRKANAPANEQTAAAANGAANGSPETEVPKDFDARAQALEIYLGNPKISGKELGEAVGLGARWGQLRRAEFASAAPRGQDPEQ
jgi:hypothetical protein